MIEFATLPATAKADQKELLCNNFLNTAIRNPVMPDAEHVLFHRLSPPTGAKRPKT
jgi:hypothetical protein